MEHIEEEFLDNILNEICEITQILLFFNSYNTAQKTLSDGRNAHIINNVQVVVIKTLQIV